MPRFNQSLSLIEQTAPVAQTGRVVFYAKTDGVYFKTAADVEVGPLAAAGSAPANMVTTDTAQTITGVKTFDLSALIARDIRAITGQALLFKDSAGTTRHFVNSNGATLFSSTTINGGGVNVLGIADATTVPTTNPTGGVVFYSEAGVIKYRTPTGAVVVLDGTGAAPANMVTTDTTQTISGLKTFSGGPLFSTATNVTALTVNGSAVAAATDLVSIRGADGATGNLLRVRRLTAGSPFDALVVNSAGQVLEGANRVYSAANLPPTMVTTDTAQTVTGVKTFGAGALLMQNGAGVTAEPYSDANAPQTLERTLFTPAAGTNPPAGEAFTWTVDGKSLDMRAPDGTTTRIGPGAGGGGGTSGTQLDLTQDWTTTSPAVPLTGGTLFVRHKARRLPAFIGPAGLDTSLQPALFSNRLFRMITFNNNAAVFSEGGAMTTYSTYTATPQVSTSFFGAVVRNRAATTATAGTLAGFRLAQTTYFLSSTANMGGFFYVARFGVSALPAGGRFFVGLRTSVASTTTAADAALTNVSMAGLTNTIGITIDPGETTLRFQHGGTTITRVDLGANFPTTPLLNFYELRMFAASGGGQNLSWSVTRLNDGVSTSGTVSPSTALPALGTLLTHHTFITNGATAAIASLDQQMYYIETDN